MNRDELIRELIHYRIINTQLKANPIAKTRIENHPDLLNALVESTAYLQKDATLKERLINIRLGLSMEQQCEVCNAGLSGRIYFQKLTYHRFCSADCRHIYVTKKRVDNLTKEENGTSKIKKIAIKNKIREQQLNEHGKTLCQERLEKAMRTRIANKNCIDPDSLNEYQKYRKAVGKVTYAQPLQSLPNIEKRGHIENNGWHLDHKFSILLGFLNQVPAEIIGNIVNLEMIPGHQNLKKQQNCSITYEELLNEYNLQNCQN